MPPPSSLTSSFLYACQDVRNSLDSSVGTLIIKTLVHVVVFPALVVCSSLEYLIATVCYIFATCFLSIVEMRKYNKWATDAWVTAIMSCYSAVAFCKETLPSDKWGNRETLVGELGMNRFGHMPIVPEEHSDTKCVFRLLKNTEIEKMDVFELILFKCFPIKFTDLTDPGASLYLARCVLLEIVLKNEEIYFDAACATVREKQEIALKTMRKKQEIALKTTGEKDECPLKKRLGSFRKNLEDLRNWKENSKEASMLQEMKEAYASFEKYKDFHERYQKKKEFSGEKFLNQFIKLAGSLHADASFGTGKSSVIQRVRERFRKVAGDPFQKIGEEKSVS